MELSPIIFTAFLLSGSISTGDPTLDNELIIMTLEAKHRVIKIENPMDEFDREYFNYLINRRL